MTCERQVVLGPGGGRRGPGAVRRRGRYGGARVRRGGAAEGQRSWSRPAEAAPAHDGPRADSIRPGRAPDGRCEGRRCHATRVCVRARPAVPAPQHGRGPASRGRPSWTGSAPVIDELGRAVRRRRRDAGAGRRAGARRDARPAAQRPRLHHLRAARGDRAAARRAGPTRLWDMGRAFGTIGCRKGDWQVEITTYRSEAYDPSSRKPDVDFGDSLVGDLGRRDFTVNAMAVRRAGPGVRGPVRRRGRPRPPGAAHARAARGLLLRRPAADDARRAVRRPARASRSPPRWSPR